MSNFDDMKLAVEALSGGKNTVLFDDRGLPSIMVRVPVFNVVDVITGGSAAPHPMFVVDGVQIPQVFISKYQNIVMNDRAYSLPFKDPRTSVTFDQAKLFSENKGAGWHLMTNAEWAGLALWSKRNNTTPRGNNNFGSDHGAAHERAVATLVETGAPFRTQKSATGSGPASWAHDGTNDGIHDLNGNVWEWVGGLRLNHGEIQVIPNNNAARIVDQSAASALWRALMPDGSHVAPGTAGTLKYDAETSAPSGIRINNTVQFATTDATSLWKTLEPTAAAAGVTIPEIMRTLGLAPVDASHGADGLWVRNNAERLPLRGGGWYNTSNAGVFALSLVDPRALAGWDIGFRSAFIS